MITTAEGPAREGPVPVVRLAGVSGPFRRGRMTEVFRKSLSEVASQADVIHAQHSLSALGALALEPRPRVVVTVRDHWPVCFWSTRMSQGSLCPRCSTANMWRCVDGRLPTLTTPLAIPYMKWDLSSKQTGLRGRTRSSRSARPSPGVAGGRPSSIHVLPNIVDGAEVNRIAGENATISLPDRFVLFVGKLEANKGARDLIPTMVHANTALPLVVLGSGSEERGIAEQAAKHGVEIHLAGWADRDDVLRAMKRAEALVFPSTWPEPLSRVLLEALALGTPIAAMDTGGTSELIEDEVSGLLAHDVAQLGDALGRIVHDAAVRSRLKEGASSRARAFSPAALLPRYEAIYRGPAR